MKTKKTALFHDLKQCGVIFAQLLTNKKGNHVRSMD